jgi:hypothetical protein
MNQVILWFIVSRLVSQVINCINCQKSLCSTSTNILLLKLCTEILQFTRSEKRIGNAKIITIRDFLSNIHRLSRIQIVLNMSDNDKPNSKQKTSITEEVNYLLKFTILYTKLLPHKQMIQFSINIT